MLHVFSSSRLVREFYASCEQDSLLPYAMSVGEFEEKILFVPKLTKASTDISSLIMLEACRFDNFKKLHIPQEFLAFLSNSSYLFRFFQELAVEQKSIKDLIDADVYAEFSEHLDILQTLLKNYTSLLEKRGYYDAITLPALYEINYDYLERFDSICLYTDGFLSTFEFNVLKEIADRLNVFVVLNTNVYNAKMQKLFGLDLPQNKKIKINLNKNSFEVLEDVSICQDITQKSFSLRSLQIPYAFEKIREFIQAGIKPENIAVVLPDESFAPMLKALDFGYNLNFAMGFSFKQNDVFKKLDTLDRALKEDDELSAELVRYYELSEVLMRFKEGWGKGVNIEEFKAFLENFELDANAKKVFQNAIYDMEVILKQTKLSLSQAFKIFMQKLSKKSIDDVRGGKITVLGVLETRGLSYEGLIILDFNDEFVPKFVNKDMFINSKVREFASLPSTKDREDLQRYFYHSIINNAKKVAIAYVENESSVPSRFLSSINSRVDGEFDEASYMSLLFDKKESKSPYKIETLKQEHNVFARPLSASRLRKFLTSRMDYYFEYILGLGEEDMLSYDLKASHVGNFIHESLEELYGLKDVFSNVDTLHSVLCDILDIKVHKKSLWRLEKEAWKKRLYAFCENEIKRYEQGWRVHRLEQIVDGEFFGVKFNGKIDRIDINANGDICVLDYKTGKVPEEKKLEDTKDFQLQFYYLLAQKYGKVVSSGYYDLHSGQIIYEQNMEQKLVLLEHIINEIKKEQPIEFADGKKFKYSPYLTLLGEDDG